MTLLRPPDWTRNAACADQPTALFDADDGPLTTLALAVCANCPVRLQCAREALDNAIPTGTWGGLTPEHRRTIATEKGFDQPGAARHGDYSRYVSCKIDNGRPCAPCCEAKRRWAAGRRAAGAWSTNTTDRRISA